MILRLAVLVELRLVTDRHRQTDGPRAMASTADAQQNYKTNAYDLGRISQAFSFKVPTVII